MLSKIQSTFEINYRGYQDTCVLVPGWASDYRIFSSLDLPFNYIQCMEFNPYGFSELLEAFLVKNNIQKLSVFGWSMGGYSAIDFCKKTNISINNLILCAMKKEYSSESLVKTKSLVKRNKIAYLRSFYKQGLVSQEEINKIGKGQISNYCEKFNEETLLEGLTFMSEYKMSLNEIDKKISIICCHGSLDNIAPLAEITK